MIGLLLALNLAPPVMEFPDPTAKFVSVQAIVKLPAMTPKERSIAALLADTIAYDVADYSRILMRDTAASAGETLKVILMPDVLRIQIGVLPDDTKYGVRFINNILRTSRLPESELNHQIEIASSKRKGLWATALQPFGSDLKRVKLVDIVDFYHRICRPDATTLVVGGNFKPGEPTQLWHGLTSDWKPERVARSPLEPGDPKTVTELPGRENILEFSGQVIPGADVELPSKLLAIFVLGSGKGSILFEKVREEMGLSYRQEGFLWPTVNGFRPRLVIATGDPTPLNELTTKVRGTLLEAVQALDEGDKQRALGMARGVFTRGFDFSPLYFNPWYPIANNLNDQTFLRGYWRIKTGTAWNADEMLKKMSLISVEELRAIAADMVDKASVSTIRATG